ncbi:MAG: choice-of-anchor D domain-containing protein [Thermoanaerobaculia bacterium]
MQRSVTWTKQHLIRLACLLVIAIPGSGPLTAQISQISQQPNNRLSRLTFRSEELAPSQPVQALEGDQGTAPAAVQERWAAFRRAHANWQVSIDQRTGLLASAEGRGIPWIPGHGNSLTPADTTSSARGAGGEPNLAALEALARRELGLLAPALGVDTKDLVLNQGSSGHPAPNLWVVDFNLVREDLPVEGAHVVFRVNNGNLIEIGSEYLPSPGAKVPPTTIDRAKALAVVSKYVGALTAADKMVDAGSLHLLPANVISPKSARGYEPGQGRRIVKVWQLTFQRQGVIGTFQARVDATTGKLLEFQDVNHYAQVTGGVASNTAAGTEVIRPLPFADLGGGVFANSAGIFNFSGTPLTSALNGQFVGIVDGTCGAISQTTEVSGNLRFGTGTGSNCATPGFGGPGNTRSARTAFYSVNRGKELARGWLPSNSFLNSQLTVNVNKTGTCNGFGSAASINLFQAVTGSCGASGEEPGFILHELGHGIDASDGTPFENTSEAYADVNAVMNLHDSCVGPGFRLGNCGGYGDACTACTGLRDIDFAKHASNTPATVSNFTQTHCGGSGGPCNKEVHCESHVASEAIWDFANRDLPNPGSGTAWLVLERLWYLSRSSSTTGFSCTTGATFTSDGCNAGSWWKAMRAVDDDDGDLTNGTPHGAALFAAFNRHGIACPSDPGANVTFSGCTPPPAPTLSVTPGDNTVAVTVSGTGGVFDIFRNELGCNAGFVKITSDFAGGTMIDTNVANGTTYFYQAVAHPIGNDACSSPTTACQSVTPSVVPQIQVPGDLNLGKTCVGATSTGTLNVCNTGKSDLIVAAITSSNPKFSVTPPSSGYPVTISHDFCFPFQVAVQPAASGPQTATLTIPSNDPSRPSVTVHVSGDGTEPNVQVTGSTDFGTASAWKPAERTLAVCNTGGCPLSVASAAVGCADFTLIQNPFPASLAPGSCLDLVARFTPVLPGAKSCTLTITSNDPDTPVVNRTLTARTPPFLSLHAGLAEPHGALNSEVRQGSTFHLDFVYPWRPRWAWDVRLGSSRFDGRICCEDVGLASLSADVKYTFNPASPVHVFVNAGLGLYHFNPGDFEGGGNLGLGLNVPVGPRFALELTYNYDAALTPSPNLDFSQVQLGLLVSF